MASDDVFLREHTLDKHSTHEDALKQCEFNPKDIREADLAGRGAQGFFELLFEYLGKELPNLYRLLDERNQARHEELLTAIKDLG